MSGTLYPVIITGGKYLLIFLQGSSIAHGMWHGFFCNYASSITYCMKKNETLILTERPSFTIVRKDKQEVQPAKVAPLKRIAYKAPCLLPPPQESYIKPKDHDFL